MYEITMPKLSDSMQEGKIIAWKVKPGARVREGDVLAEVESDKATMELECFHSGVLSKIVHGDGSEVPVGEVIGYIDAEEKGAAPEKQQAAAATARAKACTEKESPGSARVATRSSGGKRRAEEADGCCRTARAKAHAEGESPRTATLALRRSAEPRVAASPRARKLAQEKGIDLSQVKGTGPGGRIIAQDVEALSPGRASPAEKPAATAAAPERPTGRTTAGGNASCDQAVARRGTAGH